MFLTARPSTLTDVRYKRLIILDDDPDASLDISVGYRCSPEVGLERIAALRIERASENVSGGGVASHFDLDLFTDSISSENAVRWSSTSRTRYIYKQVEKMIHKHKSTYHVSPFFRCDIAEI